MQQYICNMGDDFYMHRCIQLASLAEGYVAPNPLVGAVLVHQGQIIGEGYHQHYGEAHAEVNCINSVSTEHLKFVSSSSLYVSLEPCNHHGKTPPCTELIIHHKIPRVVIGCTDPFSLVNGKGIDKLKAAGIEVNVGVLEAECRYLNRRFFCFHQKKRPFILLKWAQSANGFIASDDNTQQGRRTFISNEFSNTLVHKWRSEEAGIMVGTQTALLDNPALTLRLWQGKQPIRIVIDKWLSIPITHQLINDVYPTIVFNYKKNESVESKLFIQLNESENLIPQILLLLYQQNILSVMVEGGNKLLTAFIDAGNWDEANIITNSTLQIEGGTHAPILKKAKQVSDVSFGTDTIARVTNGLL